MAFTHARRIAGYNWPLYVVAGCGIVAGLVAASWPGAPSAVRSLALLGIAAAVWFSCSSFLAFHWMFDRSDLLSGRWLGAEVPTPPQRYVQINAGLEETTIPVHDVFPEASGTMLDIYGTASMTEPALSRARRQTAGVAAVKARPDALPVGDAWCDLVLVMLVAHEIRDRGLRERFFHELRRIVSADGTVVLVEHLRDVAAALAFGPGVFHFLPYHEWIRLGRLAGLEVQRERRITPFVRVFLYTPVAKA